MTETPQSTSFTEVRTLLRPMPADDDGHLDFTGVMAAWRLHLADEGLAPTDWPTRLAIPDGEDALVVIGPVAPMTSDAADRFDTTAVNRPEAAALFAPTPIDTPRFGHEPGEDPDGPEPLLADYDPTPGLVARGVMADPDEEEPEPEPLADHESAVARFAACHTPDVQALARWFAYGHLREGAPRDTSAVCAALAAALLASLPTGEPETEAALRHLLEAKDAAVRAALAPTLRADQ